MKRPVAAISGLDATVAPSRVEGNAAAPTTRPDHVDLVEVERGHYAFDNEIARGGMGRILRARDRRLGREVAVKELLEATPDARARFEREARITARLQHPAIVSIYEAGVFAHGEPFYAMKLVAGEAFDKVIAKTQPAARMGLLPIVLAVADALAYAHSRNVIHRDLKPHNVLVGEFGETVVIDWGLAKDLSATGADAASSPRHSGNDTETIDGAVMGTPAYMPPEQAAGDPVDQRADVYAIGAILYKALSGVTPYGGKTTQEILIAVKRGAPVSLAELAPETPQDLLTIVEKAMARDREDRYASARELAEDLRRYTTGQLVASHRYTSWQLVRRWARRHRAVLGVASVLLAALALTAVISVRRIIAEKDTAQAERGKAQAAQAVAESKRAEAMAQRAGAEKLADFLLIKLKERLEPIGKLDLLQGIGETIVAYYETVAIGGDVGVDQLRQRADALVMLADVDADKGNLDAATRSLETVHKIRSELVVKRPGDLEALYYVAQADQRLGRVAYMRQDLAKAETYYAAAAKIVADLNVKAPNDLKYKSAVSLFDRLSAEIKRERGDLEGALVLAERARVALEPLATTDDKSAVFLYDTYRTLATIHNVRGNHAGAEEAFAKAVEQTRRLSKREPIDAYWVSAYAAVSGELGRALSDHGKPADALPSLLESRDTTEALTKLDPENTLWLADLGGCYSDLGAAYHALARSADAMKSYQQALAIRGRVRERAPDDMRVAFNWAATHERIAILLFERGDLAGAARHFETSATATDELFAKNPDVIEIARALGLNAEQRGDLALARGTVDEAIEHYRKSVEISTSLSKKAPTNAVFLRDVIGADLKLANALGRKHDDTGALAAVDDAVARARQAAAIPGGDYQDLLLMALMYAANAEWAAEHDDKARTLAREAVAVGERDIAAHPQDPTRVMTLIEAESVLARTIAKPAIEEARALVARAFGRLDKLEKEGRAPAIAGPMRAMLKTLEKQLAK